MKMSTMVLVLAFATISYAKDRIVDVPPAPTGKIEVINQHFLPCTKEAGGSNNVPYSSTFNYMACVEIKSYKLEYKNCKETKWGWGEECEEAPVAGSEVNESRLVIRKGGAAVNSSGVAKELCEGRRERLKDMAVNLADSKCAGQDPDHATYDTGRIQ